LSANCLWRRTMLSAPADALAMSGELGGLGDTVLPKGRSGSGRHLL
jgi:hypothetical protein